MACLGRWLCMAIPALFTSSEGAAGTKNADCDGEAGLLGESFEYSAVYLNLLLFRSLPPANSWAGK